MAISAARFISITFSGDQGYNVAPAAAANAASPASQELKNLASGDNTITVPSSAPAVVTAVTIVPPSGNTQALTLKGIGADTGFKIHKTDPSSIALDPTTASFVINAAGTVTGMRLVWN